MNQVTAGPGDPITWGPVISKRDPRYVGFSGPVSFPMTIGLAGARVTVVGRADDEELLDIDAVMFEGIDILPALDSCSHIDIRNHFERHSVAILRQAKLDAQEDAL